MSEPTIEKDLDGARRRLLDTGTRSRLIHINRTNRRANCLNIINEQSDDIFKILRKNGQKMRFKAMGKDKGIDGEEMLLAMPDERLEPGARRYTDKFLETPLGPEALERRLLRLASDAKTAEEEQGLNILYLAIGFLRWKESANSEVVREAPLILLPVSLLRNKNTSSYNIQVRDDDLTTNLSLQKRLQEDFGISLPEIDETDEWCPSNYFARIKKAISTQPSWGIDVNGMQLGFFSFAKLLMLNDLNANAWPDNSLLSNSMLESLLQKGFEASEPLFGAEDKLDQLLSPADIIQIIDADASQTKVIEEVRKGSSLVVQGPPGTGKSQTITNIIAAAVHDGKSILFVAEKMAALSVVHDRLVKTGLRDICLEIHSKTANKKALAQEIGRTLKNSNSIPSPVGDTKKLKQARDKLNKIADTLHQSMPENGESPFQTMSELIGFIGIDKKLPEISRDGLEKLSREKRSQICDSIKQFVEVLSCSGPREQHPYRGTKELDLQPTDLARLESELAQAIKAITKLQNKTKKFSKQLRRDEPASVVESIQLADDIMELNSISTITPERISALYEYCDNPHTVEALTIGFRWQNAHQKVNNLFAAPAWSADLSTLRFAIARGRSSFLSRWFGGYRRASADFATLLSKPLPKKPSDRLALVDKLLEIQKLRQQLQAEENWLSAFLGNLWRGERTPFGELLKTCKKFSKLKKSGRFAVADEILTTLQEFSDPVASSDSLKQFSEKVLEKAGAPIKRLRLNLKEAGIRKLENMPLVDLRHMFERMHDSTARYTDWVTLEQAVKSMREEGASAIVKAVSKKQIRPEDAIDEFLYACAEERWESARKSFPELKRLQSLDRHKEVKRFRDLENARIEETKSLILNRHRDKIPRGSMGEMGIIRGEIARKRGHKPIRRLIESAGGMIQRIKPVLLMSPLSVAQFLPPGKIDFDLLVIDEASQVRPEDSFGVIARAKQIVVIGDQKQLPPTSFFDRLVDEGEDEEEDTIRASATEMESILSLCEARGMRQQMLEWHYRSRDPSLIRVSNAEFYENNLVLLPSPLEHDENYGLKFRRVDGFYSRGSTRTNKVEAQAVVKAMAQHAKEWPDYSLGVVTFSKAQADMMRQILEFERRQNDVLDRFLREGQKEDVFVKNIENVQGDERDVIFISVGYGPQEANGRLASMNFGPINKEGGERRLNVLFSRARIRCEIFCSFDPEDMNINRIHSDGPRVLKKFLDFAKTGKIEEHHPTGLAADSPFEEDVARFIRSLGYKADFQVGSAGFRIDIGVRHPDRPGQYIVAVECDGAAYHSALWARERDRLRQEILEKLGWRFHRIWSTDWFHRCEQEKKRLREMLENICALTLDGIVVPGTNAKLQGKENKNIKEEEEEGVERIVIDHVRVSMPLYSRANVRASTSCEPHEAPLSQLVKLVEKIVRAEGPLHENELARRVSSAFGKERTGRRIMEAVEAATKTTLEQNQDILNRGEFLLTAEQETNPPVRDRHEEEGSLLKAEHLPPMEICAARSIVVRENGEMSEEDTIRSIARLLGFKQVGKNLRERIATALASK